MAIDDIKAKDIQGRTVVDTGKWRKISGGRLQKYEIISRTESNISINFLVSS